MIPETECKHLAHKKEHLLKQLNKRLEDDDIFQKDYEKKKKKMDDLKLTKAFSDEAQRILWLSTGAFRRPLSIFTDAFPTMSKWKDVYIVPPVMHNYGHLATNILQACFAKYSENKELRRKLGIFMCSQSVLKVHGAFAQARSKLSSVAELFHESPEFQHFHRVAVICGSSLCQLVYSHQYANSRYSLALWVLSFIVWLFLAEEKVKVDGKAHPVNLARNVYTQDVVEAFPQFVARTGVSLLTVLEESFEQSFNKDVTFARKTQRKHNLKSFGKSLIAEALLRPDGGFDMTRSHTFHFNEVSNVAIHRCILADPWRRRNFFLLLTHLFPRGEKKWKFKYSPLCWYDDFIHSFVFALDQQENNYAIPICFCWDYKDYHIVLREANGTKLEKMAAAVFIKDRLCLNFRTILKLFEDFRDQEPSRKKKTIESSVVQQIKKKKKIE